MTSTARLMRSSSPLQVARILWGAMLAGQLVLGVVGWVLRAERLGVELDREVLLPVALIGAIVAALGPVVERGLLAAAVPKLRAAGAASDETALARAKLQPMTVRCACADVGATAALLVLLGGAPVSWWAAVAGLALAVLLAGMPSAVKVGNWRAALAGR